MQWFRTIARVQAGMGMLGALLLSHIVPAQSVTIPLITNYTTKEYDAHPQNWNIIQDTRGIMYFANTGGIIEFDSKNWRTYERGTMVFSYDRSPDGQVYMGGNSTFGVFRADSIGELYFDNLSHLLPDTLQHFTNVWNTHAIGEKVYFNTFNDQVSYLFVYENDSLSVIRPKESFHLSHKVNNEVWVLEKSSGLYKIVNNKPAFIPNSEVFVGQSIFAILPYDGNRKLVATSDGGLFLFNHGSYTEETLVPFAVDVNTEMISMGIYGGIQLQDGNYAFNTLGGGVYVLSGEGQLLQHISREQGLQSEQVLTMYQDYNGNIWCGLGNGISKISLNSPLTYLLEGNGFTGSAQAFATAHGTLHVATTTGVFSLGSDNNSHVQRMDGVNGQCFDLLEVNDKILVASHNIFEIDGPTVNVVGNFQSRWLEPIDGLAYPAVIAGGRDGLGIFAQQSGQWQEAIRAGNLPDEIISISQDCSSGNFQDDSLRFWAGTWSQGVLLLTVSRDFTGYHMALLDTNAGLPQGQITTSVFNGQNMFSTSRGLMTYNYNTHQFERDYEFRTDSIPFGYRLEMAPNNHVWISTGLNVYHLIPANGAYLMDTVPFMSLDVGGINALLPVNDGKCWIGADDAIVLYNPMVGTDYTAPYACILRKVLSNNDSLVFGGLYTRDGIPVMEQGELQVHVFPYENNNFTFEFSSSFFEHTEHTLYAYKLVGSGSNEDFGQWKKDDKAIFTNLAPGEYTFVVKAMNIYKHESSEATYTFTILPPWYLTWWAYLLYVVVGILIIVIIVRLYSAKLKHEKIRLENIVRQRTTEIANKNVELEDTNREILTQKALVEEKNRDITDSIRYAEKIQRALLTSDNYLNKVFTEHFVVYKPKDILSGDFYWAYELKTKEDWKVVFAAVDCTGHGVPGALMSIVGNTFLNEIVIEQGILDPGKILNELRRKVISALGQTGATGESRDGMDMALCVWNKHDDTLSFSGAFNPLWILRKEGKPTDGLSDFQVAGEGGMRVFEIKSDKQPVGYNSRQTDFNTATVKLQPEDEIYLFSDGFADQFGGPKGKKFRYGQFQQALLQLTDHPMSERSERLLNIFESWRGELEQVDDVCVIGVKV